MLEISISPNRMKCIEIEHPSTPVRDKIRAAVMENRVNHPAYIAARPGMPFLQADYEDYLLVEFWGKDPKPFMIYLEAELL